MRKTSLPVILIGLLMLLAPLIGCAGGTLKASLGKPVIVLVGQTVDIEGEQLAIRFNGVTGDSRCPNGVTCVWAGEVSCDVTVTYQGSSSDITLTQPGGVAPAKTIFKDYRLTFSVDPYPQAGRKIYPSGYILNLTVEK